jgi:NAD-dependent deacetylase
LVADQDQLKQIARQIVERGRIVAFTGAGTSVESGIPDFRSQGGLWERFDPAVFATIEAFLADPVRVWEMIREMDAIVLRARPNPAHLGLARLEALGLCLGVITQNIDNLHQAAGSRRVIEFHGNGQRLICLQCGVTCPAAEVRARWAEEFPPRCPVCHRVLKPDLVFFGEPIPPAASREAMRLAQQAGVCLVVGTSAVVAPASYVPLVAKKMGALVIEVNVEPTVLTGELADITLIGQAGEVIPALVSEIERAL